LFTRPYIENVVLLLLFFCHCLVIIQAWAKKVRPRTIIYVVFIWSKPFYDPPTIACSQYVSCKLI
jgi:hypothetical protein